MNKDVEDIIWRATLDNETYEAKVVGTEDQYRGVLHVTDLRTGESVVEPRDVGLSYGAMFGPDVADVAEWEAMVLEVLPEEKQ